MRLSHVILGSCWSPSEDVDFVEDRDTIRQEIVDHPTDFSSRKSRWTRKSRLKIASQKKEILEGSEEWDILYRKYYAEGLKRMGVASESAWTQR